MRFVPVSLAAVVLSAWMVCSVVADDSKATAPAADEGVKSLPEKVDLRPQLLEYGLGPRRQGSRGTCSVFTTAAALEFALAKQEGRGEPLSVEYLNWACNQVIHNDRERGQFFHDLLKGFGEYGICKEGDMPYQPVFDPGHQPSETAREQAKKLGQTPFQIHWINPLRPNRGLSSREFRQIKEVLASGYPVAAGSDHSRLLVGYSDDPSQDGGGVFYTKDSGSGRFDTVTYRFVKRRVGDVYWVDIDSTAAGEKK